MNKIKKNSYVVILRVCYIRKLTPANHGRWRDLASNPSFLPSSSHGIPWKVMFNLLQTCSVGSSTVQTAEWSAVQPSTLQTVENMKWVWKLCTGELFQAQFISFICHRNKVNSIAWLYRDACHKIVSVTFTFLHLHLQILQSSVIVWILDSVFWGENHISGGGGDLMHFFVIFGGIWD